MPFPPNRDEKRVPAGASAGAHTLPHAGMPDGLVWVQPEEVEQIACMRIALQDELAAALPELRHDHQFLRFLRGHGGYEKAVEKMRLALSYRTELATAEPFRAMRAATLQASAIDLSVLPHADEVLRHLPLRAVEGATVDGLPVCLSVTRLFHFRALTDGTVDDERLDLFFRAMIEQRALVCHQLSRTLTPAQPNPNLTNPKS